MLILRCLKSKLMDWAALQQQPIDFQYGTKTVRALFHKIPEQDPCGNFIEASKTELKDK